MDGAMRSLIRSSLGGLCLVAASISAMEFFVASGGDHAEPVIAGPGATLSLDMDISDGVCVDIDPSATVDYHIGGASIPVGVCLTNSGSTAVSLFQYTLVYDDSRIDAGEIPNSGTALDDNPDANAGGTTFGSTTFPFDLGEFWDCSGEGTAFPEGDRDPAVGPDAGRTHSGNCASPAGPNTLVQGPLGVVWFDRVVFAQSEEEINIESALVWDDTNNEIGSCNPVFEVPLTCTGGTLNFVNCDSGLVSPDDESRANGPNVPDNDETWPNSDFIPGACDPDDDNDGLLDADEISGAQCNGVVTSAINVDTDGDHLTDGWECSWYFDGDPETNSDPSMTTSKYLGTGTADGDADRVPDSWEMRGYNSSGSDTDSDGFCSDLVEIASVDGNRAIGDPDRLSVARRALNIWGPDAAQDWVLDIDANGAVGDPDRLFVARAALLPDWLPKTCP
jgi:hypothetical protein